MPTYKIGKCPFCDRENERLYLVTGSPQVGKDGCVELPVEYVCVVCKAWVESVQK